MKYSHTILDNKRYVVAWVNYQGDKATKAFSFSQAASDQFLLRLSLKGLKTWCKTNNYKLVDGRLAALKEKTQRNVWQAQLTGSVEEIASLRKFARFLDTLQ